MPASCPSSGTAPGGASAVAGGSRRRTLVVGERTRLCGDGAFEVPRGPGRAGAWRDEKALEVHFALQQVRGAGHAIDVCLAVLLRLMAQVSGYRRWGHDGFGDYITQELRQRSARRFRYLAAIDRAIVTRPLPKLGRAWRRGEVTVSQARELIRVMTPDNEDAWLQAAASCSVWSLQQRVRRALEEGAGPAPEAGDGALDEDPVDHHMKSFAATRPVDAAWQVCLETSRRMAGFDLPVHECVDDLLAEYASGCPLSESGMPAVEEAGGPGPRSPGVDADAVDADAGAGPDAWRRAARVDAEAWETLRSLGRVVRFVRLAADPLAGLDRSGASAAPDPADLHRRIRWLLRLEANVAWHHCRLMRVMADLRLHQRLGFRSLRRYAVEALGSGDRSPWALVSLARELERLPKVAAAFRSGLVSALEAAEICRVARGDTQDAWVARARCSTLREFRDDVAFVLDVGDPSGLPPARPLGGVRVPVAEAAAARDWPGGGGAPQQVQTCATRVSGAVAVPFARRVEGWYSAFGSDPQAVAAAMLSGEGPRRPVVFFAPPDVSLRWDLTLAHCRLSSDPPAALDDSQCVALVLLGFLGQWAHPEIIRSSRAYRVLTRDGWRCRAPRCRSRANLHAHHIVFRSRNGPDADWNLVTVCRAHHRMIHAGVVRVRGRAPAQVEWSMGVNAAGAARERFVNGVRVACDPSWSAAGPGPSTRSASDWRGILGAV